MLISAQTTYRIRYSDTDQMGVVYYGNYPRFYEIGRTEMIRDFGYTYKELEESGVYMPIADLTCKYHKSLFYDELITIKTVLNEMPRARMVFHHTIFNSKNELVHSAEITLVFLSKETNRPVRAPEYMINALNKMLSKQGEQLEN